MSQEIKASPSSANTKARSALHLLLSPDGYYQYLQVQKPAPVHNSLLSKDKNTSAPSNEIDKSKIEKNYRKLSLRLHPDRQGGDVEAFRVLQRAKHVLLSDKLRKEYDLLGLDLDEDDHQDNDDQHEDEDGPDGETKDGSGTPDSVLSHMASATVAAFLQMAVRTAMMAVTSLVITRFIYTTVPAMLFLLYTSYQIIKARSTPAGATITTFDTLSPFLICLGVFCMFYGRGSSESHWTKTFWIGETVLMTLFCLNTIASSGSATVKPSIPLGIGLFILFLLVAFYIGGQGWRYASFLAVELGFALIAVMVFPIMEMILEEIMNEKLRKVGERVRAYGKVMEENYATKLEEIQKASPGMVSTRDSSRESSAPIELD